MPNENLSPFPKGYNNWNYNWHLVYNHISAELYSWEYMFHGDKRLSYDYIQTPTDPDFHVIDEAQDRRFNACLVEPQREFKVRARSKDDRYEADNPPEYREFERENIKMMRERLSAYCEAIDEHQAEIAATNPEGASMLRFIREKAAFALRNYGSEAMSDYVFTQVCSQEGAIHFPRASDVKDKPEKSDYTHIMDELSDMPFMPVFENASRMINIACDHARSIRDNHLSAAQDRLSRKLLLTEYDHIAAQIQESIRVTAQSGTADFKRWHRVMDNEPDHLGGYERGPFRVPYDLEGRRIALRQGWPVEDASLIGSLFVLQSKIRNPGTNRDYSQKVAQSLDELIEEVSKTRITDSKRRTQMLDQIETYLRANWQGLRIMDSTVLDTTFEARRKETILECQYLTDAELDEAAREYDRRKALPEVAGSDGSPVGYYEQILAGTEVLSRLDALFGVIDPDKQSNRNTAEYLVSSTYRNLYANLSAFYGP
ncbi:MAG: hypothetical protein IKO13_02930, partial [Oscillospiraceae bacterium]|nr:hypothetical protein [Oscillospiraceae bacterium]